MKFQSIHDRNITANFETALLQGLAPDGGLYMPAGEIPELKIGAGELAGKPFPAVAEAALSPWLVDDLGADLHTICVKAFNFPIPIVDVGPYKILELFHGPTLAFKDVAAGFLAEAMQHYLAKRNEKLTIVVATSGDTGGAIAHAFGDKANVDVYVLFPKNGVSKLQREQLTRVASNVTPLEVDGTFDDCQAMVKQAIGDKTLKRKIGSANSINIGRLLPQLTYYVYARAQLGEYDVAIPSGNLGNAAGALLATAMGAGPETITLATNANDTLTKFVETGTFTPQPSQATLSNAMDIGSPNNFPRYFSLLNNDVASFSELTNVETISDAETIETITQVHATHNYLLDPHTAVAWAAAERTKAQPGTLIVSTASPLKFAEEITKHTGISVDNSSVLAALGEPSRSTAIAASYTALRKQLEA